MTRKEILQRAVVRGRSPQGRLRLIVTAVTLRFGSLSQPAPSSTLFTEASRDLLVVATTWPRWPGFGRRSGAMAGWIGSE